MVEMCIKKGGSGKRDKKLALSTTLIGKLFS